MTTYVGKGLKRFEDQRLIRGAGTYMDDLKVPGMVYASILRSPFAHARIKSIDISAAARVPGVVLVATAKEVSEEPAFMPVDPARPGIEMTAPPHPVLARDKVRYVGEPVAVVLAEERYIAKDAVELIKVEYEQLPAVVNLEDAAKDQVLLHEELGTNVVFRFNNTRGDIESVFRKADRVVRGKFEVGRICPAPMEPRGLIATYDAAADSLTLWNATQCPHLQQFELSHALRRDKHKMRVIALEVGGGFGQKARAFPDVAAICYLAMKLQRPIKWVEDRSENINCFHGRGMSAEVEAAIAKDGTLLGLRYNVLCDMGAYFIASTPIPPYVMANSTVGPYHTDVVHVHLRGVVTNKPPSGPYRGSGGPEAVYFLERTVDMIAAELGMDAAEIRRKNLIAADAFPYKTPIGATYDVGNFAPALERTLELGKYEEMRRQQAKARAEGRLVGVGVVAFVKGSGGSGHHRDSTARVEIDREGQVRVYTETSPHGQGGETTFSQIAADILGLAPEGIAILHGDTDMVEDGVGTIADRGVQTGASAMYVALQEARKKLSQIAAHALDCAPEEVEFQDGRVYARGNSGKGLSFAGAASRAYQEEALPPGVTPGLEFTGKFTLPNIGYSFGAQVVSVEIDRDTGEVKLLSSAGVHDSGKLINPKLVEGQAHGGLVQGFGEALCEGMVYSSDGQPLTGTFMDYAMPVAEDIPDLLVDHQETPSPLNPLGAVGVGEGGIAGAPAAVANAVVDALSPLGVRHLDSPFTPEKIWRILHGGKK